MKMRKFIKDWVYGSRIVKILRLLKCNQNNLIWFVGDFNSWQSAANKCVGYDDVAILHKVLSATLRVKRGEAAFERDSVVFDQIQYSWPTLSALMWSAARNQGRLNVLDFGGSLGSSYFQCSKFLKDLGEVSWSIVEQKHYVAAGRQHVQDNVLRFFETVDECLTYKKPDVILLSGVLQCIPDPWELLSQLIALGCDTVILDRTSYINNGERERISIQHVPPSIYPASYPCRFFVENDVISLFSNAGYELVESFNALDELDASATWKGHIFIRRGSRD